MSVGGPRKKFAQKWKGLKELGPGLITGASDDDPSGIATYSQAGARLGLSILWTMLFSYPLMIAIQEISARIGRVTGHGIAWNLRRHASPWLLYPIVLLLLTANIINLGANIGAMGAAMGLLLPGSALFCSLFLTLTSLALQIFIPYTRCVPILKWLAAALFAYVGTVFVVRVPWEAALWETVAPSLSLDARYLTILIAVLGTTLSPYLFFWQASEEAEEEEIHPREKPLKRAPRRARAQFRRIRFDTYTGMAFSNIVAYFIILACAVTLHARGVTDIETAAQAAEALRPIAGRLAALLFAMGIVGTSLLSLPVLAGAAAYAVGEALRWRVGLERKPARAKGFYGVLAAATLIGLGLNFVRIDPIRALFWTAVINGVVAAPVMAATVWMASSRRVMGRFTLSPLLKGAGWLATAVMFAASVGLFMTWGE